MIRILRRKRAVKPARARAHSRNPAIPQPNRRPAEMDSYIELPIAPPAQAARRTEAIKLYGPDAFEGMRRAGGLAAQCLDEVAGMIGEGLALAEIDRFVRDFAAAHGAVPATLGYQGYGYACCTSVNHVVCHGLPDAKRLRGGDIINVDVTLIVDGWYGDTSRMYTVGQPKRAAERIIGIAHEAMMRGIEAVRPGARLGDIGHAIEAYARAQRCTVVHDFCGHGIGQVFHDSPNILNFGQPGQGAELREGMIFTVEPMVNLGRGAVKTLADGWTAVTRDRSLSAQFEHSVGVTATGCEIFTRSPGGLDMPGLGGGA